MKQKIYKNTEEFWKGYSEPRKCNCTSVWCGKCLGQNCRDDNCKIHIIEQKILFKKRMLGKRIKDKNLNGALKIIQEDIERLEKL